MSSSKDLLDQAIKLLERNGCIADMHPYNATLLSYYLGVLVGMRDTLISSDTPNHVQEMVTLVLAGADRLFSNNKDQVH